MVRQNWLQNWRLYRQWRNMKPSHKCCNSTNNNVINTLSKLKLHVESIPVQHLGSIWVWMPVQRRSPLTMVAWCSLMHQTLRTLFETKPTPSEDSMKHMETL
jgi:hypothetical protein